MEHARRFDGIQAGHAGNAGKVLRQYLEFSAAQPESVRYEATLTICTLHSLLTQCAELLKYTQPRSLIDLQEPLSDTPNCLGLTTSVVVQDTFPEPLTGAGLLGHLRDALSHPAPDEHFHFLPTGFTTTGDEGPLSVGTRSRTRRGSKTTSASRSVRSFRAAGRQPHRTSSSGSAKAASRAVV